MEVAGTGIIVTDQLISNSEVKSETAAAAVVKVFFDVLPNAIESVVDNTKLESVAKDQAKAAVRAAVEVNSNHVENNLEKNKKQNN